MALSAVIFLVVFFSPPVNAEPLGDFYYVAVDGEITITGYRVTDPKAVIPAQIDGLPVTRIASGAFVEWPGLLSIQIPASVERISETAFGYGLWSYTSGLAKLESIRVDPKNPYYTSVDGVLFNKDMTRLIRYPISKPGETYLVPQTVTSIAESAFLNCDFLAQAILPQHLQSIGDYAFSGCKSITRMDIPDTVTELGQGVFKNCTRLQTLHLPTRLTYISDYLCLNCTELVEVNIPDQVVVVGAYAFSQCRLLEAVRLPVGVTAIDDFAFSHCRQLDQFEIPIGVTFLGDGVFSDCQQLESITVPSGVGEIRAYAFSRCFSLKRVQISDGIRLIGDQAFFSCVSLSDVILPDSVESIGIQAFSYCTGLESIRLPSALTALPLGVLARCTSLKEIEIPPRVTRIEQDALRDLKGLERLTVDPQNASFSSRDSLLLNKKETVLIYYPSAMPARHLEIPDGVTTIRSRAFYLSDHLQRVTIPASVERIEPEAFLFCEQLEYAHFLGNAPQMDIQSFKECHNGFTLYYQNGRTGFERLGYPVQVLNTGGLSVTFRDWDGTTLHGTLVPYGQEASPPAEPTRIGYQFTGWDKPFSTVQDNLTVTAVYTAIRYPDTRKPGGFFWLGVAALVTLSGLVILFMVKIAKKRTSVNRGVSE